MTLQEIKTLHAYNSWATNRIFNSLSTLPSEQYKKEMQTSHGSIHATLTHMVGAEKVWLERWLGSPQPFLKAAEIDSLESLRGIWETTGYDIAKWLGAMTDKKLQNTFEAKTSKGDIFVNTFQEAFQHVVNHSSYHRGQIVGMMRQLGAQPIGTDMILFFRETAKLR